MKYSFLALFLTMLPLTMAHVQGEPTIDVPASYEDFLTVGVKDGLADNFVRHITRDSHGYLWFSTINGLSRYDGYRFVNYKPVDFGSDVNDVAWVQEAADSTLWMASGTDFYTYDQRHDKWNKDGAARIKDLGIDGTPHIIYIDDGHNLWVSTERGIYYYDYGQRELQHVACYSRTPIAHLASRNGTIVVVNTMCNVYQVSLSEHRLVPVAGPPDLTITRDNHIFIDSSMTLWVYNAHAPASTIRTLSLSTRQWQQPVGIEQMGDPLVNALSEDNEGRLWVGTDDAGIHVFDRESNLPVTLNRVAVTNAFSSRNSHISCFYLDDNNTMWVGSAKLGVAYSDQSHPRFKCISTGEYEDVSTMMEDDKGNLWIGFDGDGLIRRTPTGTITEFSAQHQQLPSNLVTSLAQLNDGSIVVGTYGSGMARYDGQRFVPVWSNMPSLKYVKAITTDRHGHIWVATVDQGVVRIDTDGAIVTYTSENSSLLSNGILCLASDQQHDMIYIGSSLGVSAYDNKQARFVSTPQLDSLRGNYIYTLMTCHQGLLWIGSREGLWVYSPLNGTLDHLTTQQGLSHDVVRALSKAEPIPTQPAMGNCYVWASTDHGLTFIRSTKNSGESSAISYQCHPFFESDGLQGQIFSNNATLTTSNGSILLGSFTGYVSIPSGDITTHIPKLQVQFTGFRINGKPTSKSPTDFTIRYKERPSIFVSAMVPAQSQKVRYLYRFKGDKEWLRAPDNMFYFASLMPGTHVLQVKAEVPGVVESEVAELAINVTPPFWMSWPAIMLYILLLLFIAALIWRSMRLRQKREMAIKQLELNLEKYEMEEEKIRFYTNISHDLKTPLTLVVAPLEKIRTFSLPAAIRTEVDVAWRNARQLYDLVLEVLDFRRIDEGREQLNLRHGDVVRFVRQTVQGFAYLAKFKELQLTQQIPNTSCEVDFDENKLRRVIVNLLSNACKYNVEHGTVTVTLDISHNNNTQQVVISVADTGIGVNDKRHIFERFVQESHGQQQEGSGLGLHIVKQYVDIMGG